MENNNEGTKTESSNEDSNEGVQQETTTELDRADQIAQMQKRENDRREELIIRDEALEARKTVGGKSEAGEKTVTPKKLTDVEYAEAMEKGEVNPFKEDGYL